MILKSQIIHNNFIATKLLTVFCIRSEPVYLIIVLKFTGNMVHIRMLIHCLLLQCIMCHTLTSIHVLTVASKIYPECECVANYWLVRRLLSSAWKSPSIGIWATRKHNGADKLDQNLAWLCFESIGKAHHCNAVFCWPCLSTVTVPPCASAHAHNLVVACILVQFTDRCTTRCRCSTLVGALESSHYNCPSLGATDTLTLTSEW